MESKPTGKFQRVFGWLAPGLGLKRWVMLILLGAGLCGAGLALLIVAVYRTSPQLLLPLVRLLARTPLWPIAVGLGLGGLGLVMLAFARLNHSFQDLPINFQEIYASLLEERARQKGPRVVAIGGGHGMPTLLRGLKAHTNNITAVVTVADDGGSSGRLRRDLGVLPPGDFRNNIVALARDEGLMTQLFQYRFGEGGLEGHSFGNLLITALNGITGSFEAALAESSRVLAVRGQVLPSTLADVTLIADIIEPETEAVHRVAGESAIPQLAGRIVRVSLRPAEAPAYPEAVKAILAADLIVLGPGSLYTSLLPNLLVPGIAQAVRSSRALKVYVCNVASQAGETEQMSAQDHARAIEKQAGPHLFDVLLVNDYQPPPPPGSNYHYVGIEPHSQAGLPLTTADLLDRERPWRHDPARLAQAVLGLLEAQKKGTI